MSSEIIRQKSADKIHGHTKGQFGRVAMTMFALSMAILVYCLAAMVLFIDGLALFPLADSSMRDVLVVARDFIVLVLFATALPISALWSLARNPAIIVRGTKFRLDVSPTWYIKDDIISYMKRSDHYVIRIDRLSRWTHTLTYSAWLEGRTITVKSSLQDVEAFAEQFLDDYKYKPQRQGRIRYWDWKQ